MQYWVAQIFTLYWGDRALRMMGQRQEKQLVAKGEEVSVAYF